ncbi:hypothetical protein [Acinetobacter silvestris]|uniref:DUF1311 domain-containing protein n=1 Tax=Acinetobacter silvestris TaxID=1977882 RepID=A0A1Y3CK37_9GAMM|nr:hypothetical protein [Acinetobacter silvestris]OTG65986.1 hypothetical protein B9T28_07250 [Acinetobacter silvestris]
MNKLVLITALSGTLLMSGCDFFKPKKEEVKATEVDEWSCTNQANISQIQQYLKDEYLKQIDKDLRNSSYYEADQELLSKINNGLKFEIKNIRTITADPKAATQLECESQLTVSFPKGLQKRAENAFLEQPCEECEGKSTLRDRLETNEYKLTLDNDTLKGAFNYNIIKTDKEGLSLNVQNQNAVIDGVVLVAVTAVQYEAYVKLNKSNQEQSEKYDIENAEQTELAQKAMNIRKKELDEEKAKQVDRLNQTWDRFTDEQKAQLQQDQSEWFEKRDVDCKVISQKSVGQLSDNEKETYQKQSNYWDDALRAQNQEMQYTKCFNQKTTERIVYLNNVFN